MMEEEEVEAAEPPPRTNAELQLHHRDISLNGHTACFDPALLDFEDFQWEACKQIISSSKVSMLL